MTLLPPHSTSNLEKQISHCLKQGVEIPVGINDLWQFNLPYASPLLPWQIENLLINFLTDFIPSAEDRGNIAKNAVNIYRHLGTVESIKLVCKSIALGDVQVLESPRKKWYEYDLVIERFVHPDKVEVLRKILNIVVPVRCTLGKIIVRHPLRYNGEGKYNAEYTFGCY